MGGVGNIDTIRSEILKQAEEQASAIVDREKRVAERDLEFAKEDAETVREQERLKVQPLVETEEKKVSSAAEMEARRMLLEKKEELVSRLFADVQHKLEEMRGSDAYIDIISRSIEDGFKTVGESLIVEFGEKDENLFTNEIISSIKSKVSESLGMDIELKFQCVQDSISSGVVIKSKDRRVIMDHSFSNLMKGLKEELRGKVSEILLQE